jgi:hypothetical protein
MNRFHHASRFLLLVAASVMARDAVAQTRIFAPVQRLSFDSPEAWALKYFTSATLMSGLPPPPPLAERPRVGSITFGLELGWIPALSPEQARVGFSGKKREDLNKVPILARPNVRIGLPWKFSVVAAGPPPIEMFGVKPRLFALGLERPILERSRWTLGWRASGQLGTIKGAITCPRRAVEAPSGSPDNPSGCIATSSDVAHLRYAGTELQFAYRITRMPKLIPHAAAGINFIDSFFQVDAPLATRLDRSRLWTRGKTFSTTAGVTYRLTDRLALTVDAFYTPLWVRRDAARPRVNDGLFNMRALISYTVR